MSDLTREDPLLNGITLVSGWQALHRQWSTWLIAIVSS